jgi:Fe-S-cluster-containing hydrogenase component 2
VQYVEGIPINKHRLFYKPIKKDEQQQKNSADNFMTEKCIKCSDCVGVCMDAARITAGNRGLQALTERSAADVMWTHCMIHRESLAMKELCPGLSEVMDT